MVHAEALRFALRVLHLIPSMAGGGAERALSQLAGPLAAAGCDVHVGLLRGGPHEQSLEVSGVTVHRIGAGGNYDPRILWRIDRLVRRVRPDIMQTWLPQMDVAGGVVARLRRVPWILTERSSPGNYPQGVKDRVRLKLASGAALIASNSEGGSAYWASQYPAIRRAVIPNPLPLAAIAAAQPVPAQQFGSRPLILFAGRLTIAKNIEKMLDAVAQIPEAVMVMLGEGELDADVRRWIAERNLGDRVVLQGFVGNVWSWMKSATMLVSVSLFEGRPNVVLEAAACRVPLVLSGIPAHRELLESCNGARFVDAADAQSIARGIRDILADPAAATARADAAYASVTAWTPDTVAAAQIRVYEGVLGNHNHGHNR